MTLQGNVFPGITAVMEEEKSSVLFDLYQHNEYDCQMKVGEQHAHQVLA